MYHQHTSADGGGEPHTTQQDVSLQLWMLLIAQIQHGGSMYAIGQGIGMPGAHLSYPGHGALHQASTHNALHTVNLQFGVLVTALEQVRQIAGKAVRAGIDIGSATKRLRRPQ
jgi:hypothetical protein